MTVSRIGSHSETYRERRFLGIVAKARRHALCDAASRLGVGFRQNQSEFIPTIARSDINFARVKAQNIGKTAKGAASDGVTVSIINSLKLIQIKQDESE